MVTASAKQKQANLHGTIPVTYVDGVQQLWAARQTAHMRKWSQRNGVKEVNPLGWSPPPVHKASSLSCDDLMMICSLISSNSSGSLQGASDAVDADAHSRDLL
jgi:hypothetical protein